MAYKIDTEVCKSCGTCESVCPQEAIHQTDGVFEINPDECVDCGLCTEECAFEAISAE